MHEQVN